MQLIPRNWVMMGRRFFGQEGVTELGDRRDQTEARCGKRAFGAGEEPSAGFTAPADEHSGEVASQWEW